MKRPDVAVATVARRGTAHENLDRPKGRTYGGEFKVAGPILGSSAKLAFLTHAVGMQLLRKGVSTRLQARSGAYHNVGEDVFDDKVLDVIIPTPFV